jgi:hypothetical protein
VAKHFPSAWAKNDPNASDHDAMLYKLEGRWEGIPVRVITSRDGVCQRVQVGTELVIIPAVEAAPETVEERPVFEYQCEPLLAKAVAR